MAKKAYVYNGSAWEDLASSISDLSSYATTVNLDNYQLKSVAGLTLINTTTFSAVSSQSINDAFSATYDNYLILIGATGSTTNQDINFRLRISSTDNTSAVYSRSSLYQSSTTVSGQRLTGITSWIGIFDAQSGVKQSGRLLIFNPFIVEYTSAIQDAVGAPNGNVEQTRRTFGTTVTTSYTGFTVFPTAGTITGTVSVYGYAK